MRHEQRVARDSAEVRTMLGEIDWKAERPRPVRKRKKERDAREPDPVKAAQPTVVRIPWQDWHLILSGAKQHFRNYASRHGGLPAAPKPCLLMAVNPTSNERQLRLGIITACEREPLGAITPSSLEMEGFDSLDDFRSYWRARYVSTGFRPLDPVTVYTLRVAEDSDDIAWMGTWAVARMFGDAAEGLL